MALVVLTVVWKQEIFGDQKTVDDLRVKTNPKNGNSGGQILELMNLINLVSMGELKNIDLILTILTVKIDG